MIMAVRSPSRVNPVADILPLLPSPLPADLQVSLDAAVAAGNFAVLMRADGAVVVIWRDTARSYQAVIDTSGSVATQIVPSDIESTAICQQIAHTPSP